MNEQEEDQYTLLAELVGVKLGEIDDGVYRVDYTDIHGRDQYQILLNWDAAEAAFNHRVNEMDYR